MERLNLPTEVHGCRSGWVLFDTLVPGLQEDQEVRMYGEGRYVRQR